MFSTSARRARSIAQPFTDMDTDIEIAF